MRRFFSPLTGGLTLLTATLGLALFTDATADETSSSNPERPYIRVTYTIETDDRVWRGVRQEYRRTGVLPPQMNSPTNSELIPVGVLEYVTGPDGMEKFSMAMQNIPIDLDLNPLSPNLPLRRIFLYDGVNTVLVQARESTTEEVLYEAASYYPGQISLQRQYEEYYFPSLSTLNSDFSKHVELSASVLQYDGGPYTETILFDESSGLAQKRTRNYSSGDASTVWLYSDYQSLTPTFSLPKRIRYSVFADGGPLRSRDVMVQTVEALSEEEARLEMRVEVGRDSLGGWDHVSGSELIYFSGDGQVDPATFSERIAHR